jgi:hypothetical protein
VLFDTYKIKSVYCHVDWGSVTSLCWAFFTEQKGIRYVETLFVPLSIGFGLISGYEPLDGLF